METIDGWAPQKGIPRTNRDWCVLGEAAFGQWGCVLVSAIFRMDLLASIIYSQIIVAVNLQVVFERISVEVLIVIVGLMVFLAGLVPRKYFAIFSSVGIVALIATYCGLFLTLGELLFVHQVSHDKKILDFNGFPTTLGLSIVTYVAHSTAPFFYNSMANRDEWTKACVWGVGGATMFFLSFGLGGFLAFGSSAQQIVMQNIGRGLDLLVLQSPFPGYVNASMAKVCGSLMALKVFTTIPVLGAPLEISIENTLNKYNLCKSRISQHAVYMFVLAILTLLAVLLRNHLLVVLEFIGIVIQSFMVSSIPFVQSCVCSEKSTVSLHELFLSS